MLGYTIAAEIDDIHRFASPAKLSGYTGVCPCVYQSGNTDRRGPLTHAGPKYLRWALMEAATHACRHPVYRERYERNKARLGKQRGAKVAQVDIARRLNEAIWQMLTRDHPSHRQAPRLFWPHRRPLYEMRHRSENTHTTQSSRDEAIESCVKRAPTTACRGP